MTKPKAQPTKKTPTRRLQIPITAEVINNAVERDSAHCVIADAIHAALPGVRRVSVDLQTIRFTTPEGERIVYLTPANAQELIVNFDQGAKPEPGSMYLARPIVRVPARRRVGSNPKTVTTAKHGGQTHVTVEGGHLPPTGALSNTRGRVRRFGIEQMKP